MAVVVVVVVVVVVAAAAAAAAAAPWCSGGIAVWRCGVVVWWCGSVVPLTPDVDSARMMAKRIMRLSVPPLALIYAGDALTGVSAPYSDVCAQLAHPLPPHHARL